MSMTASCDCGNIKVDWDCSNTGQAPRACQCDYCKSRSAAYVSQPGTRLEITIEDPDKLHTVAGATGSADFHECLHCARLVYVTAEISGRLYGVVNWHCLSNREAFPPPEQTNFSAQSVEEKRERWRKNWCHPVVIRVESQVIERPTPCV